MLREPGHHEWPAQSRAHTHVLHYLYHDAPLGARRRSWCSPACTSHVIPCTAALGCWWRHWHCQPHSTLHLAAGRYSCHGTVPAPVGWVGNLVPGRRFQRGASGLGTHFYFVGTSGRCVFLSRWSLSSHLSHGRHLSVPFLGGVLLLHVHRRFHGRRVFVSGHQCQATHDKEFIAILAWTASSRCSGTSTSTPSWTPLASPRTATSRPSSSRSSSFCTC